MTKIKQVTQTPAIDLALDTINLNKQALVFVNTKRSAEKVAEDTAKKLPSTEKYRELADEALNALSTPTKQCKRLAKCLKVGIAFHHAGLHYKQKQLVENNFRKGVIKIIACTPTLAIGLDLPAYRAIIRDLKRFGHHGLDWIPVLEYMQIAGRAGRPKYDKIGEAICLAPSDTEKEIITEQYIHGDPEDIYSKLAVEPVLRTYVLSLIATRIVNTKERLFEFFTKTFWAHQFKDMDRLEFIIEKILKLLEQWEFVEQSQSQDFVSANEITDNKLKATKVGKRVAELYVDPLTANHFIECIKRSKDIEVKSFSLIQMAVHTLEMRPLLRVKKRELEEIEQSLIENEEHLIEKEPSYYDHEYSEFLNSIKTTLLLEDWISEMNEEFILNRFDVRPGELRVKLDNTDWLLYSAYEIANIAGHKDILSEINKLRLRIKHGAKEELLPLLKLKGIGRIRARKLFKNKIKDLGTIKTSDPTTLAQLIGKATAEKILEQVGIKVYIKTKPKKRKGQISLNDF